MEAARSFAEAKKAGHGPRRTVQFALWGAEEFGMIGSTEFCENYEAELGREAVAYINLDAAANGTMFYASASPTLWKVIEESTKMIPQARGMAGQSVHDAWLDEKKEVEFGAMGGGSDHVGFYCRLGIPSCGFSSGGAAGTAYHSKYDSLTWYRKVVGDDYEPALMLARLTNIMSARLADDAVLPIDPAGYAKDMRTQLDWIEKRAKDLKVEISLTGLRQHVEQYEKACAKFAEVIGEKGNGLGGDAERVRIANAMLEFLERMWMKEEGLPGRPWFRNWEGASDPDSGYAAWGLPALRWAVEHKERVAEMVAEYEGMLDNLREAIETTTEKLGH
jgi:N-acetylated-alpha-linked acidic dipeptidase